MKYCTLLLVIPFALCMQACKKNNDTPVPAAVPVTFPTSAGKGEFIFNNPNDVDIIVHTLDTVGKHSTKAQWTVKARSSFTVPASTVTQNVHYDIFWRSVDCKISNWYDSVGQSIPGTYRFTFDSTKPGRVFNLSMPLRNDLLICYKNADSPTHWKAVDAIDSVTGNSIWNLLTANKQYVTLRMENAKAFGTSIAGFTCFTSEFKDASGNTIKRTSFRIPFTTPFFKIQLNTPEQVLILASDLSPVLPKSSSSVNTIFLKSDKMPVYYVMAKQP
jgi:hypothetical protein